MGRRLSWGLLTALVVCATALWFQGIGTPAAPAPIPSQTAKSATVPTTTTASGLGDDRSSAHRSAPGATTVAPTPLAELERQFCSQGRALWEQGQQWVASLAASDPHAIRQLSGPALALRETGERLLKASLAPVLVGLQQQGSERAQALADYLSLGLQPNKALTERLLEQGRHTKDPLVLLMASRLPCPAQTNCERPDRNRWSALEPDNAMAWLDSDLRGDALLQRLTSTAHVSTHWDTVRRLLNQAQPASTASPGALHLEVHLIGVEAAWSFPNLSPLSQHCKSVAPGSAQAQRCADALELLWRGTAQEDLSSQVVAGIALGLPPGIVPKEVWVARKAWIQRLRSLESDWAQKLELDPLTAGCEANTPARELLAAVRNEGRMAMLQRLMTEWQSAAAAQRP